MKIILLWMMVAILGAVEQAAACSCGRYPEAPPEGSEAAVAADLESVDALFVGKVVGVQPRVFLYLKLPYYLFVTRGGREVSTEKEEDIFRRRVRLKVDQAFKGVSNGEVEIYTGWGGGDCGYDFRSGSRYLVYAYEVRGTLRTGICSSTKSAEKGSGEISILRRLTQKVSAPRHGSR